MKPPVLDQPEDVGGDHSSFNIGLRTGTFLFFPTADPGYYVGKHRDDSLHNGSVVWSNLFGRFRRVAVVGTSSEDV